MTSKNSLHLTRQIAQAIDEKKGSNLIAIDVQALSPMVEYVIIADGNVDRHVIALAKEVQEVMREAAGEKPLYKQGMEYGDWIALDYFAIMVHIFTPEMRQKYQLERVWSEGSAVDLYPPSPSLLSKRAAAL